MAVTVEGRRGGKGEDRETPKAALTPLRSARDQNRGQNNAAFSEEAPQPYSRSITERYIDDITAALPSSLRYLFVITLELFHAGTLVYLGYLVPTVGGRRTLVVHGETSNFTPKQYVINFFYCFASLAIPLRLFANCLYSVSIDDEARLKFRVPTTILVYSLRNSISFLPCPYFVLLILSLRWFRLFHRRSIIRKVMRDCFEERYDIYLNRIAARLVMNSEKISGELSVEYLRRVKISLDKLRLLLTL